MWAPRGCLERRWATRADVWQGTLALMVLKALDMLGPHGIARCIEQTSGDNNRKAKFNKLMARALSSSSARRRNGGRSTMIPVRFLTLRKEQS